MSSKLGRAGRRLEVVTTRGVVEVREVTRSGNPVRTARFMATRLIALVEHPAADDRGRVEISTRHQIQPPRDEAQLRANPLGLFITDFHISQELGQ